jgi:predicted O-methyltransferase YrrM
MSNEIEEIRKLTKNVDGFLSEQEGEFLYKLAKNCAGKGVIVEIGSWKGKSTIWLAAGSKVGKRIKVYAIDPHTGSSEHKAMYGKVWTFPEFKKNIKMAKVNDIVVPIVKTSEEAAKNFNKPVELLFIDGAHEYEFVKKDAELWIPKVVNGGFVAFYDVTGWPGPRKVFQKFVCRSKNFKNIGLCGSIGFAQKIKKVSIKDRLRNYYFLLLIYLFPLSKIIPTPLKKIIKKTIKLGLN